MADHDRLAEVIWHASRADEGTISAIGADHVAAAVRAFLASDETVERAARAIRRRNHAAGVYHFHREDARAALAAATEVR